MAGEGDARGGLAGGADGAVPGEAGDGEDRPLHGAGDGPVGGHRALGEGGGEEGAVARLVLAYPSGDPGHDLGEDHPGVAPGAHHRALGGALQDGAGGAALDFARPLQGGAHGQEHVRPRVPIRDGEDVQGVDRGGVALQPGSGGLQQAPEVLAPEGLRRGRKRGALGGCGGGLDARLSLSRA